MALVHHRPLVQVVLRGGGFIDFINSLPRLELAMAGVV
jgi:hypothetical protein